MGGLVVSQNVSLDGVMRDPTGEEGFRRGGWFTEVDDLDRAAWAAATLEEAGDADALLFGRRTYEFFASRWPSREGALADRLNTMRKYVVSSTLDRTDWGGSTRLGGDVVADVAALKEGLEGPIVLYGSRRLAETLLAHGLVDEVRLTVFPVVLGSGDRLLGGTGESLPLRFLATRTLGRSLAQLSYTIGTR